METRAGHPGAFAHFDLNRVSSPAFVVDSAKVRANLARLADVKARSGAKILAALKAFSLWRLGPCVAEYLDGVCASGLYEARLAQEEYGGRVTTYCPAYKADELLEICSLSDHLIFNSPGQHARFRPLLEAAHRQSLKSARAAQNRHFDVGLRINPQHSEACAAKYDPAAPHSRLGFPISQLKPEHLVGISGLHMHTLCEQDFPPLARIWEAVRPLLAPFLAACSGPISWINFGGGHHITRADYQVDDLIAFLQSVRTSTECEVIIEPGEALALDAGILVGEIRDIFDNDMLIAITDISATCHVPDVLEAPYRPAMLGEAQSGSLTRLGGPTCLASDVIGDYCFSEPVRIGQRFALLDQAHYTMVKTNMFNGVALPSIWLWDSESDALEQIRAFTYDDYKNRLS